MQAFTPPVAHSGSCAPAGRLRGPLDPQSARWLWGRSDFAACSSLAPVPLLSPWRRLPLCERGRFPATRAQENRSKPRNGGPAITLAFTALALFHTAMFLGSIPLAIVLTTSLGGVKSDVGLAYSLCAALEIVVMGALIWRPLKRAERPAIVAGFAVFVAYFVALAPGAVGRRRALGSNPPGDRHCSRDLSRDQLPTLAHATSRRRSRGAVFERRSTGLRVRRPQAPAFWRRRSATRPFSLYAPFSAPRVSLWFA